METGIQMLFELQFFPEAGNNSSFQWKCVEGIIKQTSSTSNIKQETKHIYLYRTALRQQPETVWIGHVTTAVHEFSPYVAGHWG